MAAYQQNDEGVEDCIERTGNNEDVVARNAMGRDGFVPISVYWLTIGR